MKKIIYVVLFLFCFISCSEKKKNLSFDTIDYSYYNGWDGFYSIKIYNTGTVYIMSEEHNKEKVFIRNELSAKDKDSLSILLANIGFLYLDTLYEGNCVDCGYYYLLINNPKYSIRLFVEDLNNRKAELKETNSLSFYLMSLIKTNIDQMKSTRFESKTIDFSPILPFGKSDLD